MCAPSQDALLTYGLKVPSPYFPFGPTGSISQAHISALDFQRSQLNDYNVRVQLGLRNYQNSLVLSPFHAYITDPYSQAYFYKHDPRGRFVQEEPKPSHSYIGLIGMAILNSKEKKLVLSDIYQWILDNYSYFRTRGPGWRNSIRHNLSLNDCFIKAGRSANGKGHYWAVHPANVEDFERGDFRRRRAQRKVRRHMGLSVPDDDDSPTPSPTQTWSHHDLNQDSERGQPDSNLSASERSLGSIPKRHDSDSLVACHSTPTYGHVQVQHKKQSRKRLFDMASLLAPDDDQEEVISEEQIRNEKQSNQKIHFSSLNFHATHEKNVVTDKNNENTGSNSIEDANVDMENASSGREIDDDRDDDVENDEIQVTSEDDSPTQSLTCDSGQLQSLSDPYDKAYKHTSDCDDEMFKEKDSIRICISSQQTNKSTTDKSCNFSSLTHAGGGNQIGIFSTNNTACKRVELIPSEQTVDLHQQHVERASQGLMKKDIDFENCRSYEKLNSLSNSIFFSKFKNVYENENRSRQRDDNDVSSQLTYRDRHEPAAESLKTGRDMEHISRIVNTFHSYRQEPQKYCQQYQDREDSNAVRLDSTCVESDQTVSVDDREVISEVHDSESVRVPRDHYKWTDISNGAHSRNRLSAFSTLGIRNQAVYSYLQLRNVPLCTRRLLPTSTPLRAGIQNSFSSVSATSSASSVSLVKGLDSDMDKCRYKLSSNICSNTNT